MVERKVEGSLARDTVQNPMHATKLTERLGQERPQHQSDVTLSTNPDSSKDPEQPPHPEVGPLDAGARSSETEVESIDPELTHYDQEAASPEKEMDPLSTEGPRRNGRTAAGTDLERYRSDWSFAETAEENDLPVTNDDRDVDLSDADESLLLEPRVKMLGDRDGPTQTSFQAREARRSTEPPNVGNLLRFSTVEEILPGPMTNAHSPITDDQSEWSLRHATLGSNRSADPSHLSDYSPHKSAAPIDDISTAPGDAFLLTRSPKLGAPKVPAFALSTIQNSGGILREPPNGQRTPKALVEQKLPGPLIPELHAMAQKSESSSPNHGGLPSGQNEDVRRVSGRTLDPARPPRPGAPVEASMSLTSSTGRQEPPIAVVDAASRVGRRAEDTSGGGGDYRQQTFIADARSPTLRGAEVPANLPLDRQWLMTRYREFGVIPTKRDLSQEGSVLKRASSSAFPANSGTGFEKPDPDRISISASLPSATTETFQATHVRISAHTSEGEATAVPVDRSMSQAGLPSSQAAEHGGSLAVALAAPDLSQAGVLHREPMLNEASTIGLQNVGAAVQGSAPFASSIGNPHGSISRQIGQAVGSGSMSETVLRLEPEELGRVTLNLRGDERSMTLFVHAERPETLDLIRRGSHELARELSELGYDDITFEFGDSSGRAPDERPQADQEQGQWAEPLPEEDRPAAPVGNRLGKGQVDIRI